MNLFRLFQRSTQIFNVRFNRRLNLLKTPNYIKFSTSIPRANQHANPNRENNTLFGRVRQSFKETKVDWKPIPIGVGITFIALYQLYKSLNERETEKTRSSIKGPWTLQAYTSLPLKSISRFFGNFNSIELPVFLRSPGYRLYSFIFGCNLDEMEETDLSKFPNLSAFFYRKLKPGVRPIDGTATMVSPADGKVLHFGVVEGGQIEQIKGLSYPLDDLLGKVAHSEVVQSQNVEGERIDEENFANVNGIPYSLHGLFDGESNTAHHDQNPEDKVDGEVKEPLKLKAWQKIDPSNDLYFCVVYLAPGDYHRFHSPTNWVVSSRRHFAGELYSVSPFLLKYLPNLFVLNERVALIGRWRYGFYSMLPVGATNVGSIKINFDQDLKTNQRQVTHRGTYCQVSYHKASPLLGGYPVAAGQEMGGFSLGSTVVLVFEAPKNFHFEVKPGQKVKVGEKLGSLPDRRTKEE